MIICNVHQVTSITHPVTTNEKKKSITNGPHVVIIKYQCKTSSVNNVPSLNPSRKY